MIEPKISIALEEYEELLLSALIFRTTFWTGICLLSLVIPLFFRLTDLLPQLPVFLSIFLFSLIGGIVWCAIFAVSLYRSRKTLPLNRISWNSRIGILAGLIVLCCWPVSSLFLSIPWAILLGFVDQF